MFCRHELDLLNALPKYRDYHVDHDRERILNHVQKTRADAARHLQRMKEERDARVKLYHEIRSKATDKRRRDIAEQHRQTDERYAVRVGERAAKALVEMEEKEEKAAAKELEARKRVAAEKKRFEADTVRRREATRTRERDDKAWGWHYVASPGSVTPCGKAIAATTPTASGRATPSTGAATPSAAQPAAGAGPARPTSARQAMARKPSCSAHLVVDAAHAAASAQHRQSIKRPSSAPAGRTPRGPTEKNRHYEIQAQLQALLYTPHGRRGSAAADLATSRKQLLAWGASSRPQGVRPGQMTLEERLAHRTYSSSKAERARLYAEALSDARREVIALRIVEADVHGVDGDEPTPEWGNATTTKKRDDRLTRLHKLEEESIRALDDPTIEQAPVPSPHVRAKQHASVVGDQRRPPPVKEFRPLRPRNVAGARFA